MLQPQITSGSLTALFPDASDLIPVAIAHPESGRAAILDNDLDRTLSRDYNPNWRRPATIQKLEQAEESHRSQIAHEVTMRIKTAERWRNDRQSVDGSAFVGSQETAGVRRSKETKTVFSTRSNDRSRSHSRSEKAFRMHFKAVRRIKVQAADLWANI